MDGTDTQTCTYMYQIEQLTNVTGGGLSHWNVVLNDFCGEPVTEGPLAGNCSAPGNFDTSDGDCKDEIPNQNSLAKCEDIPNDVLGVFNMSFTITNVPLGKQLSGTVDVWDKSGKIGCTFGCALPGKSLLY